MANLKTPGPLAACIAGALSLAIAMGIGRFAFTPLLPLMVRAGQLEVGEGGWLAAANYLGYLAGAVSAARIALPAARLGLVALLLTAALTAAMALPGPWPLWLALRFFAGACSAWAFVATSVWCLSALAQQGRAAWGSGVYAGVGGGIALAGLYCLGGAAFGQSATALWLQLGLLALLLSLPVWAVLRRQDASPAPAQSAAPAASPPAGTPGLVLCYGLMGFGYILPATFLPVLARTVVDDPKLFGLAWPVFGLMAASSTLLAGWVLRRASRMQVWAVSQLLMGLGVLLPSLWLNGAAIALSAILVGGTFMVITMAGVQEIRARVPASPTAWVGRMTAAFAIGQIAGPVVSTLALHAVGAGGLNLALQLGAAGLFLSAAWLWRHSLFFTLGKEIPHAP